MDKSKTNRKLLASPFACGLSTFCMNGGLIVWFVHLLFH